MQKIITVGTVAGLESLTSNLGRVLVQFFVTGMGTSVNSAYQVANTVNMISGTPVLSYCTLSTPIVAQYAGTGNRQKTHEVLRYLHQKGMYWANMFGIIFLILAYPICLIFTRDPEVLLIATWVTIINSLIMPTVAPAFLLPAGFKGARDVNFSMIVSTMSMWVVRIGGAYLFSIVSGLGIYGIFVAVGLDQLVRAIFFIKRFKGDKWQAFVENANLEYKKQKESVIL